MQLLYKVKKLYKLTFLLCKIHIHGSPVTRRNKLFFAQASDAIS